MSSTEYDFLSGEISRYWWPPSRGRSWGQFVTSWELDGVLITPRVMSHLPRPETRSVSSQTATISSSLTSLISSLSTWSIWVFSSSLWSESLISDPADTARTLSSQKTSLFGVFSSFWPFEEAFGRGRVTDTLIMICNGRHFVRTYSDDFLRMLKL